MTTQLANNIQKWCSCARHRVQHQHIGLQDFGWVVMDVYQCARCGKLKYFPIETEEKLRNRKGQSGTAPLASAV